MSEIDIVRLLGGLHFCILIASALVPFQLDWKRELGGLPRLHYQMYFIYGGYVVLNIVAFGVLSVCFANEISSRGPFPRAFCAYVAVFWGICLGLQGVMDARPYLTKWWLIAGYHTLTLIFAILTIGYGYFAVF